MSADNLYLIRRHPLGGYAAVMGFASDDMVPEASEKHEQFESIENALVWAADEYAEYGVDIHPECFDGVAEVVTPKAYTELGQWAFSNGEVMEFEAHWASAGLILLADIIAESRGDRRDDCGYEHVHTSNSGVEPFENDTFAMRAYCWCDGDIAGHELACPPNFEHKPSGLRISWYKHASRGITANQTRPTDICWWRVLNECVESIQRVER